MLSRRRKRKAVKRPIAKPFERMHLAPPYSSALINKFKKQLKQNGVDYVFTRKKPNGNVWTGSNLVVDRYNLVIYPMPDGRFRAWNKTIWKTYTVEFTAYSILEIVVKLVRYKIIQPKHAKEIGGWN